ncbi:hypothetical protein LguiA_036688 [Lonicera macranthoides]
MDRTQSARIARLRRRMIRKSKRNNRSNSTQSHKSNTIRREARWNDIVENANPPTNPYTQTTTPYKTTRRTGLTRRDIISHSVVALDGNVVTTTNEATKDAYTISNSNYCGYTLTNIRTAIEASMKTLRSGEPAITERTIATSETISSTQIQIPEVRETISDTTLEGRNVATHNVPEGSHSRKRKVKELKIRSTNNDQPLKHENLQNNISTETQSKTIYEILNLHSDSITEEIILSCKATIYDIAKEAGWFYNSCRLCGKRVKESGSTFWCAKCNSDEELPKPRYKLHIQVRNDSASTTFAVFDREAEKILKVPITQLYKGKNINEDSTDNSIPIQPSEKSAQLHPQASSVNLNKRKEEKNKLNEAQIKKPKIQR